MDVMGIVSMYVEGRQQKLHDTAEMAMMKKGLELEKVQGQQALSLIASVTPSSSLPANLGQNLNVIA